MKRSTSWNLGRASAAILALVLAGCAGGPVHTPRAEALAELRYPEAAQAGPSLDILVLREGPRVRLINRTPNDYRNMQLWLNRQYVQEVEHITIGRDNIGALSAFFNRHQEPFPVGGPLTPELSEPLIAASLYDPQAGVRYPLVVQPGE